MKETRLINRFFEKNSDLGKWSILGPKIVDPHNSGSAGRIFLKFCTMKGANRWVRVILIIFQKIFCLGQMDHFGPNGPKMAHPHNSGLVWRIFKKFCIMKRANRQMKVLIMFCTKKNLFMTNGPFWARKWHILITLDWRQYFLKNFAEWKGPIGTWKFYLLFFKKKINVGQFDLFSL